MTRPALRSMRALPVLEPRRDALEKCVFCPKLCRSACPVSNAEPRETITPWGKMSIAWMAAHGDVPIDVSHAAPAWACTGCLACRESCDHRNVVADVLLDSRDALARAGQAPEGARRLIAGFARHDARTRAAAAALGHRPNVRPGAKDALLVGCGYLRAAPPEARDAVDAATAVVGRPVDLAPSCCGLPLRLAGDAAGFARHARGVAQSLSKCERVIVVDAGCALALKQRYAEAGVHLGAHVETLVEVAARRLSSLARVAVPGTEPVRWHDPCQLGRGLGVYEAPRNVLTRVLGRAPEELEDRREQALCSGAGGLLPATMPAVARAISAARWSAHERAGGGRVVTGCAASLLALRRRAAGSGIAVDDLVTWIARAARGEVTSPSP
jgi:Fe-S oxidoreductase